MKQEWYPTKRGITSHLNQCKICNFDKDLLEKVNRMLLQDCTDSEVIALAKEYGESIDAPNVHNHRKFLPFLLSDELVEEAVRKAQQIKSGDYSEVITDMEARIAEVKMKVLQAQENIKLGIWEGALPELVSRIQKEAMEGVVPVRDLAYALDLVMKNGLLLMGGVTSRAEVNVNDTSPNRPKDVKALTASIQATLEAINRANEAIEENEEG